jgi:two-component system, OmpR family, sensor histidine kinase BaeS
MTLRSRLAAGLVTIAVILVCPLVFAIRSLHALHDDAVGLRDREFAGVLLLGRLREGLNDLRHQELGLLFTKDAASRQAMGRQVELVGTLSDSLIHFQFPDYARDIGESIRKIAQAAPAEYDAALASDTVVADSLSFHVFVPALNRADSIVRVAESKLRERTFDRVQSQTTEITAIETGSIAAMVLALILAGIIAIWLTRSINQPIVDLKSGMHAIADGDLSYRLRIPSDRSDEFGELARSFHVMSRQLGELDKLKAEFVSVASHELKTPINVMMGYLQLLEEGVYGPLTPKQLEVHKTLGLQANTLARLVSQLLDVSRFEAGGGRLEPRPVQIDAILADLENAFQVLAVQRQIQFRVERHDGLPDQVVWDLDRINEVLGNLLSNAFKFTPHGGSVELSLEPVDGGVLMEVHDTGAGIPPEQLPHIFEKFYQADNQRSARASGAGLGLAIAKQIVEAHGGTISCESTPGVGTTFSIMLPAQVTRRTSIQRPLPASI